MSNDRTDSLLNTLDLLFKPHPWHGVPIGDEAPEVVAAFIYDRREAYEVIRRAQEDYRARFGNLQQKLLDALDQR